VEEREGRGGEGKKVEREGGRRGKGGEGERGEGGGGMGDGREELKVVGNWRHIYIYHLQHFHDLAYSATTKEELMEGIDEFLDSSLVLPPGDWGEDLLLPALHERNNLRKRKSEFMFIASILVCGKER
jgi:hypothetical protein